ncbi:MAG: HAMP domain-containing protein [Halanaerobium sp. MSAO_Bac5]|nr:MAG: HAMP domain-containing protein [Halanaerobium sp. MSAO_Bac5]
MIKNWKSNSLFTKLLFRFIVLALILISVFGFIMIYYLEDFFFNSKENEVLSNLNEIKADLEEPLLRADDDEVNQILNLTARMNRGQIWLTDRTGNILYSYPSPEDEQVNIEGFANIFDNKILSSRVEPEGFDNPMVLNAISMEAGNEQYGLLFFSSVDGITSTINQVKQIMLYLSVFSAFLALLIAYLWSKSIAKPLKNITTAAEEISRGNFTELPAEQNTRELKNLAISINNMSRKLKKNLNNLREEKNKLNHILSGMDEGVLALNKERKIILLNDAFKKLFAVDGEESAGLLDQYRTEGENLSEENLSDIIPNREIMDFIESTIADQESKVMELKLQTPEEKYLLIHSTAIFRGDEFWGVVLIFQDISERWRFEKLQNDFVANVSHELKTPLSSIRGAAEVVFDGAVSSEKAKNKYLNMIIKEANHLEKMVNNILSLSELKSDSLNKIEVEFSDFVYNLSQNYREVNNIKQNFKYEIEKDIRLKVDSDKIKRVIINLLDNAVKYSPDQGEIKLKLKDLGSQIKFAIEDQGPGIPDAEAKNIWERFYKINKKDYNNKKSGSGLGLAIAKDIIELHGGEIYQKNTETGSEFVFLLNKDKE